MRKPRKTPKQDPRATGDCYEANCKLFLSLTENPSVEDCCHLVHAEVVGRGELNGLRFAHCYIEMGGRALDFSNGNKVVLPVEVYRALGGIDRVNNLHRYSRKEAVERLLKVQTYGPWDLRTSTGL